MCASHCTTIQHRIITETFLPLDLPPSAAFFHRNLNGVTPSDYGPVTLSAHCTFDGDFCSQDFLVAGDVASGRYILVGALTAERSLSYLALERRQGRFTGVRVRQPDIGDGADPEEIVVIEGGDWRDLVLDYAARVSARAGIPASAPRENLAGYCSWYYYYGDFGTGEFRDVVATLKLHREAFPCRIVQIDDGYQAHHGDWLTCHERWQMPLEESAALVREAGCTPGIWVMPFLASTASEVFLQNPDWFVKGEDGTPYLLKGWSPPPDELWACLDTTRDDVCAHIAGVFKAFFDMGFGYFKLDGTGMSLPSGRRSDPLATPLSAYRKGMRAIRQAVPKAHILGCGTPFLATLGLVDSVRVSPDTGSKWQAWGLPTETSAAAQVINEPCNFGVPCLRNALHYSLAKWWMADRWFRIDPDCVMARDERTSLTAGEARMSALVAILAGTAMTSDHPGRMSADRIALFARAASLRLRSARPLESAPGQWPQCFLGTLDGRNAAAIFNDSESARSYPLAELGLPRSATELLHPLGEVSETLELPAHDAALLVEAVPSKPSPTTLKTCIEP